MWTKEQKNIWQREYYQKTKEQNKEKKNKISREYYYKHKERLTEKRKEKYKNKIEYYLWLGARSRAKRKNIPFSITVNDIILPEKCPLLGITLCVNSNSYQNSSYSLDRIDNTKGYTKDNIWVISNRANSLKKDASLEELLLLVTNLQKALDDCRTISY